MMGIEYAKVRVQCLVAPRLARLSLQRADLALYFLDNVTDAQKICLGRFELAQRVAFLRFIFCNPGRFFKNRAAIFWTRAQDHVDLTLFHHRVSGPRDAGVGKKILNVAKSAGRFVQEVFGIAVAIHTARHAHVVPIDRQLVCTIGESDRNLRKTDRLARVGAVENNVGHLVAAKRFGGLFAQDPAHGVKHIRFPAAVRPDNSGDAFVKIKNRFIGERFEAEELERL